MAAEDIVSKADSRPAVPVYAGIIPYKSYLFSQFTIPDEVHAVLTVSRITQNSRSGKDSVVFSFDDFIIISITETEEDRNNPTYTLGPTIITTSGSSGPSTSSGRLPRMYQFSGYILAQDSLLKSFSKWVHAWDTYFKSAKTAVPQSELALHTTRISYLRKSVYGHVVSCQLGFSAELPGTISVALGMVVTNVI